MKVYWIKLRQRAGGVREFGVTAANLEDALLHLNRSNLLEAKISVKNIEDFREVQNADELDQRHVVPNMGVMVRSGIWFPNLNS